MLKGRRANAHDHGQRVLSLSAFLSPSSSLILGSCPSLFLLLRVPFLPPFFRSFSLFPIPLLFLHVPHLVCFARDFSWNLKFFVVRSQSSLLGGRFFIPVYERFNFFLPSVSVCIYRFSFFLSFRCPSDCQSFYVSPSRFSFGFITPELSSSLFASWKFDSLAARVVCRVGRAEGTRDSPPGNVS